jgi:hypothetical protein
MMSYVDTLPSKAQIFDHWKDRLGQIGIFIDWGEPSCWACHFHYGAKYDIKSSDAGWDEIFDCWDRMPLQRCQIVPRSLGGSDDISNLFLMCRECHDLAPNTSVPAIFFQWAKGQRHDRRETAKLENEFRSFRVTDDEKLKLFEIIQDVEFQAWTRGKFGLHWPQSKYAPISSRLTPATFIGLAAHYLRFEQQSSN